MIALNYTEAAATIVCYPLVVGGALYNAILLVFRRHPVKNTSLIDYNIIMIIIPNGLYASVIGTLINDLLPPIVANVLITILLGGFSIKFFFKLKAMLDEDDEK